MYRLHRYHRDASYALSSLRTNGTCQRSMLRPANPSSAGSRVTEAAMTMSTAGMTVNANPVMDGWSISRTPSRHTTTVRPATMTARPAVVMALSVARRGSSPWARLLRKRVTMSRA
jgi:hypothetical protein